MSNFNDSRRKFLKAITTSTLLSGTSLTALTTPAENAESKNSSSSGIGNTSSAQTAKEKPMNPRLFDGPSSPLFIVVPINGATEFASLTESLVSKKMADSVSFAPDGEGTAWGIPFTIAEKIVLVKDKPVSIQVKPFAASWLVFLHTSDEMMLEKNKDGFYTAPFKGTGQLNEHIADYIIIYDDGEEARFPIRQRYHIGIFQQIWGENCIEAVAHRKLKSMRAHHEQINQNWGTSQTRARNDDRGKWINWLWAVENPAKKKMIVGFRFEPLKQVPVIISAISAGTVQSNPLRWQARQKALLSIPEGTRFDPTVSNEGLLSQLQLDLGQVISATPRLLYPNGEWQETYNNKVPAVSNREILVEYTSHPEAHFHLSNGNRIPVTMAAIKSQSNDLQVVAPAVQLVKIRVFEKGNGKPVAVKLHVHGETGEYLAPADRHRLPNNAWFEDYSVDFVHKGTHNCTYIPGETWIKLPVGKAYIEVSKGFEMRPVRKVVPVTKATKEISIEIDRVLPWRERGWVTADTHVHFLSPGSALLEGAGEGVNVVNLLASQWGELMTNVGDFDGTTTYGSKKAGGDGEYLVRVGTENRQHVLGHISLLGYDGSIITPLTTGGPDESALGDPVEILLTEWAKQCVTQNGIVVLPHFPNPRLENAAAIVSGNIHGVEMTSWGDLYSGINPYSLSDWYRYLNCGYFVAAVGGTDKMSAGTAVGTVRTYAKIDKDREFTYDEWKNAIRKGHTFVSYGPLIEFTVNGQDMGSRIEMTANGGTVDVTWQAASVTVPMSRVELIVNGEIRESITVSPEKGEGHWSIKVDKSSWLALLVRGHYPDQPEIIAAHSSPVMVMLENSPMIAAADAVTILEQIEGALAYIDTVGTRAEDEIYKRMRLVLESAQRTVHNRMHQLGYYHNHTPVTNHREI